MRVQPIGETTITSKNQVSLPVKSMRLLNWRQGDRLLVDILGDDMVVLIRRPEQWSDAFAGKLTHVFGTHEETVRWLEEERERWEHDPADAGR